MNSPYPKYDEEKGNFDPTKIEARPGAIYPATENQMRTFASGATRNVDINKLDYEGFLSPLVLKRYAQYLHKHRKQADGNMRASDNWQKGIPLDTYMKSAFRHFMDLWAQHRGFAGEEDMEDSICAVLFNVMGYLHERIKGKEKS